MRKRLLLILGCLAVVLLAGYVALRLTAPNHQVRLENFEKIKLRMTEEEVEAILGVPASFYAPAPGALNKKWVTQGFCISVLFRNGQVTGIIRGSDGGSEPFLDKLRRCLGIQ